MIFLGCLFDRKNEEQYLKNSRTSLSNAANTFQWNLIEGLNANLSEDVTIVNVLPVGVFPRQYKQLVLKDRIWEGKNREIGCINLPFIKQYQRYRRCLKLLKKSQDRDIVVYSAYLPFLKAVSKLDKSYNVTVIITDLPEYYDLGKVSGLKRFFRKRNNQKIYKCLQRVDKFVLLTEQMKEPLQIGNRPYTVIEGICNSESVTPIVASSKEKAVLYTGTLHKRFGMGNLLAAFSDITSPEYRLWICGGGDMRQEIEAAALKDPRIEFFGYVSKQRIAQLQQQATILVNPRQNNDEFTKYSFPSKTMEYMASGKPVLMYKLDGVPEEYGKYLHYVPDDTVEALKNAIVSICEQSEQERAAFGKAARQFVLEEKSGVRQARRLIDFINN